MKVLFWPYWNQADEGTGNLEGFLTKLKLQAKHPKLYALAKATVRKAGDPGGLEAQRQSGYAAKLRHESDLWEFRIPPKRRGGVLRIYFCILSKPSECIVCLDSELKKRANSSGQKVDSARQRLREIATWLR